MFQAFEAPLDVTQARRLVASSLVASVVLAGALLVTFVVSARSIERAKEKSVDVAFRPPPTLKKAEPPPPPPPAPKPRVKPPPPPPTPTPTPVVVAAAPAAAPMEAPTKAPLSKPKEASADEAVPEKIVAVGGQGDGSGNAVGVASGPAAADEEPESQAPVVASAGQAGPISLPEDAEPPDCSENQAPEYPESARATGQEAKVVLKVVVEKDGSIGRVQVLKGEEPFVSAATAAISTWRCAPASMDGQTLSVFKIINIPFRLRAD